MDSQLSCYFHTPIQGEKIFLLESVLRVFDDVVLFQPRNDSDEQDDDDKGYTLQHVGAERELIHYYGLRAQFVIGGIVRAHALSVQRIAISNEFFFECIFTETTLPSSIKTVSQRKRIIRKLMTPLINDGLLTYESWGNLDFSQISTGDNNAVIPVNGWRIYSLCSLDSLFRIVAEKAAHRVSVHRKCLVLIESANVARVAKKKKISERE